MTYQIIGAKTSNHINCQNCQTRQSKLASFQSMTSKIKFSTTETKIRMQTTMFTSATNEELFCCLDKSDRKESMYMEFN
ncbi:hypothetical protein Mapa_014334 [Marchantia paleacea]|nr:hypothetical protein Mapa_014334 [Marchantia paleacea]